MFNAVLGILHDRVLQQAEDTAAVHADYHYTHCINSFKLTSAARKTILIAGMDTAKNIWNMALVHLKGFQEPEVFAHFLTRDIQGRDIVKLS